MTKILTKEQFINMTPAERKALLKLTGKAYKYFIERHEERRELTLTMGSIAQGFSGHNRKMLEFIAEEIERLNIPVASMKISHIHNKSKKVA